jgi:hypothetical protein
MNNTAIADATSGSRSLLTARGGFLAGGEEMHVL